MSISLRPDLVFCDVEAESSEDVLRFLGQKMNKAGIAKDSFVDAILRREAEYPTGLQTSTIGIAIPHANPENVNEDAFAIAKLLKPVEFYDMGDPENVIRVEIVVMMSLTEGTSPISVLSSVLEMFTDNDVGENVRNVKSSAELYELFSSCFSGKI